MTPRARAVGIETGQCVEGAAELEGAHALEVLALEEHRGAAERASTVCEVNTGVRCAWPLSRRAAASTSA